MRVLVMALLLAGCGSGGGASPNGSLSEGVSSTLSPWLVLDLATGAVTAQATAPPLAQAAYRDRLVAFRRIAVTRVTDGAEPGTWARQDDETVAVTAPADFYIAALELTRAQWRRLAGSEPWRSAFPVSAADRDDLPALCLTTVEVRRVLAAWQGAQASTRLHLPDHAQWVAAARPPGSGAFPWGDDHAIATAQRWACTADAGGAGGPLAVGALQADSRGLHDVCGNAWELTADGTLRGGGWCDPMSMARIANRQAILEDTPHEGAGARLCLVP